MVIGRGNGDGIRVLRAIGLSGGNATKRKFGDLGAAAAFYLTKRQQDCAGRQLP